MIDEVLKGQDALKKVIEGVEMVSSPVVSTLGYGGKNVILGNRYNTVIHKDGANIARFIVPRDNDLAIGAGLVKEAAIKTLKEAGDGTTTCVLFVSEILKEGAKQIAAGWNGMKIKKGIDKAVDCVVDQLKSLSLNVKDDPKLIRHVATISANNDSTIGDLIAGAYEKIGTDGIVSMEESFNGKTEVKVVEGYQIEKGLLAGQFVNNQDKLTCELKDVLVLVTNLKVETAKEIMPVCEYAARNNKSLLIIAKEMLGEPMQFLVANSVRGIIKVCVIPEPSFGEASFEMMEDIASVVGATLLDSSYRLEDIKDNVFLGYAEKAVIGLSETLIINAGGKKEFIEDRVKHSRKKLELASDDYSQKQAELRLAKLINGLAVIYVGAATEMEKNDKKERVDDAIRATRSAIEEGCVAGGGTTMIRCIAALKNIETESQDEKIGVDIIARVLEKPLFQMCENYGLNSGTYIDKVKGLDGNVGYNFKTEKCEDLIEAGVIDATKVARCALQNAASISGMILTSNYFLPNKD
jgi:chaperonin GroEL